MASSQEGEGGNEHPQSSLTLTLTPQLSQSLHEQLQEKGGPSDTDYTSPESSEEGTDNTGKRKRSGSLGRDTLPADRQILQPGRAAQEVILFQVSRCCNTRMSHAQRAPYLLVDTALFNCHLHVNRHLFWSSIRDFCLTYPYREPLYLWHSIECHHWPTLSL